MDSPLSQFRCLELIPVRWRTDNGGEYSECAVLHEIGSDGGLLQVDRAVAAGTPMAMTLPHGDITAEILSCTPEDAGYILEIRVHSREDWLEGAWRPADLIPLEPNDGLQLPIAS